MRKQTKLLAIVVVIVIVFSPLSVHASNASQKTIPQVPFHSGPIRVACVGDSITENSGYPMDLQALLGDNFTVANFGCSGSTVSLESWKPYMDQPQFQSAEAFHPDIIIIILGTNDDLVGLHVYNASFEGDYAKLITSFMHLDNYPDVWIAKSPPIFSNSSDLSPAYLTDTILPKTDDLANRFNLPIIDLYSAFGNNPEYFEDGVHPNSQGAAIIADQVYNSLNSVYNLNQTS